MRDFILTFVVILLAPLALRFPFAGVYLWEWLSLMNPHRLAYSFAQDLPFNMVVAVLTLLGCLLSRERFGLKLNALTVLVVLFSVWITLTTVFAPTPEVSTPLWSRNIKTMLLMFMIMGVITNRARLQGLVWIMAISLGYFGVKGGAFMILTGGNNIVFGPPNSMIEDNNSLALALIITLPLMNYLRLHTPQRWLKLGLVGAMVLSLASILGSYSRGGFIAMGAMLGFLWLKGRSKLPTAILGMIVLLTALVFMPDKYMERIQTISSAMEGEDSSFQGRLEAWQVAFHTASDRVFGAGFDGPRQDVIWKSYLPDASPRASHSIYFMVMGEHGFIGLGLYLLICLMAWRSLGRVTALTRDRPDLLWAADMSTALKVSMLGFLVGGAALPMAYYDGFLSIVALSASLLAVARRVTAEAPAKTVTPIAAGLPPLADFSTGVSPV